MINYQKIVLKDKSLKIKGSSIFIDGNYDFNKKITDIDGISFNESKKGKVASLSFYLKNNNVFRFIFSKDLETYYHNLFKTILNK